MRKLLALAFVLAASAIAFGNDSPVQRADGFWYYPGFTQAYTRTVKQSAGYYSCGRYYPGYSYYEYAPYHAPAAPYVAPPPYSPDWKVEIIKAAEKRDDIEAYNAAIARLFPQSYGYTYGTYGTAFGFQAGTGYGLSLQKVLEQYAYGGNPDLFMQAADQHTANAQRYGDVARESFLQMGAAEQERRAQAVDSAMRYELMKSLLSKQTFKAETKVFGSPLPPAVLPKQQAPAPKGANTDGLEEVIVSHCAKCHGPTKAEAKLDLSQYLSFDDATKARIWRRIDLPEGDKDRMPPPPAKPLTSAQKREFAKH